MSGVGRAQKNTGVAALASLRTILVRVVLSLQDTGIHNRGLASLSSCLHGTTVCFCLRYHPSQLESSHNSFHHEYSDDYSDLLHNEYSDELVCGKHPSEPSLSLMQMHCIITATHSDTGADIMSC
jgi:hypothetical protein